MVTIASVLLLAVTSSKLAAQDASHPVHEGPSVSTPADQIQSGTRASRPKRVSCLRDRPTAIYRKAATAPSSHASWLHQPSAHAYRGLLRGRHQGCRLEPSSRCESRPTSGRIVVVSDGGRSRMSLSVSRRPSVCSSSFYPASSISRPPSKHRNTERRRYPGGAHRPKNVV